MAVFNFLHVDATGKTTRKPSSGMTPDFAAVRIGANNEQISEVSSGILTLGATLLRSETAPSHDHDLTNKAYVDGLAAYGIKWKNMVKVATIGNITLSAPQTIDDVAAIAGDRVLVKDQTAADENGVYVVAAGAWTRATDLDTAAEIYHSGVFVEQGTANADTAWIVGNDAEPVLETDPINYVKFNSNVYAAGDGLTLTGNSFATKLDTSESSGFGTLRFDNILDAASAGMGASAIHVRFSILRAPGGAFSAFRAVYVDAAGKVQAAAKNTANLDEKVVGIVTEAATAEDDPFVVEVYTRRGAIIDGFTGLTAGKEYFINSAGALALFADITWANGDFVYSVGRALTATHIVYDPQFKFIYST